MKFKTLIFALLFCCIGSFAQAPDDVLDKFYNLTDNRHYKEALELILPYAEAGNDSDAELKAGWAYIALKNYREGIKWYKIAIKHGNPVAMYNLAFIYYDMYDYKQAYDLFKKSSKAGYADSTYMLGYIHYDPTGYIRYDKNYEKAVRYFQQAADEGSAEGQYFLGLCYYNAHGVPQNTQKARELIKLAAKNGSKRAKQSLNELGWN